jgi:RimJ/RimL family protein N-acetyltransferase
MNLEAHGDLRVLRAPLLDVALVTERLKLRPLQPVDAPDLARALADVQVSRWLARVPHPYHLADARTFVDHVRLAAVAGTAVTLGITLRGSADDSVVGVVALHGMDGMPEFGYWLARPHWGRGLMTEAAGALLAWCFARLDLDEIASGAFEGNAASLAIQSRFGFVVKGRSRRACLARGGLVDHVDTRLTRGAFRAPRPS